MHYTPGIIRVLGVQLLVLFAWFSEPVFGQHAAPPKPSELQAAADGGDAKAQDKLGDFYAMRFDYARALTWYRKAAERGVANSQFGLGRMLMRKGVDWSGKITSQVDVDDAIKWYASAANQCHAQAQVDLGQFYEKGELVTRDYAEAYKWYSLAAKGPPGEAPTITGKACRDGLAAKMTPAQTAEAKKRVEKFLATPKPAAEQTQPFAVGLLILSGISGPENHRVAIINERTFEAGKENQVKIGGQLVKIRCLEIRKDSVLIKAEGVEQVKELKLKQEK